MKRFAKSVFHHMGKVGSAGLRLVGGKRRLTYQGGQSGQNKGGQSVLSFRRLFLSNWTLVGTAGLIWLAIYLNYVR